MEIKTSEATLKTLSVTIKGILVNDKQMTLAVFRQIPPFSALLNNGTLDSSLRFWGIVRYSIKDEGDLWAVADREENLIRCKVWETYSIKELVTREVHAKAELEKIKECGKERHTYLCKHETSTFEIEMYKRTVINTPMLINETNSMAYLKTLRQLFIAV